MTEDDLRIIKRTPPARRSNGFTRPDCRDRQSETIGFDATIETLQLACSSRYPMHVHGAACVRERRSMCTTAAVERRLALRLMFL